MKPTIGVMVEYYQGRSPQTQFPDDREAYWSLGFAAGF